MTESIFKRITTNGTSRPALPRQRVRADELRPLIRPELPIAIDRDSLISELIKNWFQQLYGPSISSVSPTEGRAGCQVVIEGTGFSTDRESNEVTFGGQPAFVVSAAEDRLHVITSPDTMDGAVDVLVDGKTATWAGPFTVLPYPKVAEDGPPILFTGTGEGLAGDLPATGTSKVLVALVTPSDVVPGTTSTARQTVVDAWENVKKFYNQASFGTKTLQADIPTGWVSLSGTESDYVDYSSSVQNIRNSQLGRIAAEAAKKMQDAGYNLNSYDCLALTMYLNGNFIRAWGGWEQQSFSYDDGPGGSPTISITTSKALNMLAISESANWGRLAHEVAHNMVDAPDALPDDKTKNGNAVFDEDVYSSDLVDPSAATAMEFELMGNHDHHPLFSAYHMERLGWYRKDNPSHDQDIRNLKWDRNAFTQEFEVVAHGGTRNTVSGRYHAIKIEVAAGLFYFIEVRQRPGTVVFDDNIPFGGAPNQGGVVVTKVVTDTVNNNQQYRFITLLHDPATLKKNETAIDPARALTITVLDDNVVNRPLVCRVRVEWAQGVVNDPNGAFDLSITPWDGTYTTPDIWVDRKPYGSFDKPNDSAGRPQLNGDKPRPNEVNKIFARINCTGTVGVTNAKVTFYVVEPPGVGDNGNWAPLVTRTIASIAQSGSADVTADWVPRVGRHTCLKVYVSPQFGEVSGGNNFAQENVNEFEAPAYSPPAPVVVQLAVRNPKDESTVANIDITGVPRGYQVQFPHSWVHLDAHQERIFDMVVVPFYDVSAYVEKGREAPTFADVRVSGRLPRQYDVPLATGELPGSRFSPIGGVLSRIRPVRGTAIELSEDDRKKEDEHVIGVHGVVSRAHRGDRVAVYCTDQRGETGVVETFTEDGGYFEATIDLAVLAADAGRNRDDISGEYAVQAHTFAADTVAEASSQVLTIRR